MVKEALSKIIVVFLLATQLAALSAASVKLSKLLGNIVDQLEDSRSSNSSARFRREAANNGKQSSSSSCKPDSFWNQTQLRELMSRMYSQNIDRIMRINYDLSLVHELYEQKSVLFDESAEPNWERKCHLTHTQHEQFLARKNKTKAKSFSDICPHSMKLATRKDRYPDEVKRAVCGCFKCFYFDKGQCKQNFILSPVLHKTPCQVNELGQQQPSSKWHFKYEFLPVSCSCQVENKIIASDYIKQ